MRRENFYRRDPAKALAGMTGLTLEERAVYGTIIDLLYVLWRPIEDDRRYLAGWCGCAVQKLNPIIQRLLDKGRIIHIERNGRTFISDEHFEEERATVKGPSKGSGRGKVEEKSAGVEQNPPTCGDEDDEKQDVGPLEKRREEKRRETPLPPEGGQRGEGLFGEAADPPRKARAKPIPADFPDQPAITAYQTESTAAGADLDMAYVAERFRNWALGKDARYADWTATWRNWARKAIKEAPKSEAPGSADPKAHNPWPYRMRAWTKDRHWEEENWGPRPGRPGCQCPPEHRPNA